MRTVDTLTTVRVNHDAADNFKLTLKTGVEPVVATCCTLVDPLWTSTKTSASTAGGCWEPTWSWAGAPAAR